MSPNDLVNKKLGNTICEARRGAGFTQLQFALKSGIDQSNLSKYERGERKISVYMLHKFAQALDLSIGDLYAAIIIK